MTHTPGPWGDERKTVIVRGLTWVAHAHYPSEEGQANAKLIAAAPELLSIVKRFVALPSGAWHPERRAAEEAELTTEAHAVIAKATQ